VLPGQANAAEAGRGAPLQKIVAEFHPVRAAALGSDRAGVTPVSVLTFDTLRQRPEGEAERLTRAAPSTSGRVKNGRFLTPPPERRIHPAAPVPLARLPDESGVPVGVASRLGGGAEMRPSKTIYQFDG